MSLYSGHIFENTKGEVILIKMIFEFILIKYFFRTEAPTQPAIACSKLTIETLEQGVKYVQS